MDPVVRNALVAALVGSLVEVFKRGIPRVIPALDETDAKNAAAALAVIIGGLVNVALEAATAPAPDWRAAVATGALIGAGVAGIYKAGKDTIAARRGS